MNVHALSLHRSEPAPARRRFSVSDVERMVEAGVLDREVSVELLDGELIDMPSEGDLHVTMKTLLTRALNRLVGDEWWVVPDAPLHLSEEDAPEPDIYLKRAEAPLRPAVPSAIPLVIEIADSSLGHDLGRKATKYADYDIAEYWVVDLKGRQTHVLTHPAEGAYHDIKAVPFDRPLTASRLPAITLTLADLPL